MMTATLSSNDELHIPIVEPVTTFRNPGLLDLRGITVFGLSGKETENAIGKFGTGLKYAIAILLRERQAIEIWIDGFMYSFHFKYEDFRNKTIHMVYMMRPDGTEVCLNFTTALGAHWGLWQAFRELYSNCLDEQGTMNTAKGTTVEGSSGETVVVVYGEEFYNVAQQKQDIFLETPAIKRLKDLDLHDGETTSIFHNGIKVFETAKPLMHKYDMKGDVYLTEDRTLKYPHYFDSSLAEAVTSSDSPELIAKVVTATSEQYESGLNFSYNEPSNAFLSTIKRLIKKGKSKINPTALRLYETAVKKIRETRKANSFDETYAVTVKRPKEVSTSDMEQYIEDAVNRWCGQLSIDDPLFRLEVISVHKE